MPDRISRRRFFQQTTGAFVAGGVAAAGSGRVQALQDADDPSVAGDPPVVSAYTFEDRLWIRVDDEPFACYRTGPRQKYPYFFPLAAPVTGLPMTDEAGAPFPHHRSLFLGCDHVNGANFWQLGLDRGQIISRGATANAACPRVTIRDACDWRLPDQPPMLEDERRFTVCAPDRRTRMIDADITVTARTHVRISRTNHSLFALRAARWLTPAAGDGLLLDSEGRQGEQGTFGQVARWCGFQAERCGIAQAIVLMDHPRNPWSPSRWFTRDYGFISPTEFQWLDDEGWSLPAGESVRLRYRVLAIADILDSRAVFRWYNDFADADAS